MRLNFRTAGLMGAAVWLLALGTVALPAPAIGAAPAEGKDYGPQLRELSKKLDELAVSQKELKTQLDTQHATVMEELRIIKVRAYQAR